VAKIALSGAAPSVLSCALLNPSDGEQHLNLSINGATLSALGHLWRLAPQSVDATITVGQKPGVEVEDKEVTSLQDTESVPPFSVNIYSFAVICSAVVHLVGI
jgi:alpha-N-arabinofuranosidase